MVTSIDALKQGSTSSSTTTLKGSQCSGRAAERCHGLRLQGLDFWVFFAVRNFRFIFWKFIENVEDKKEKSVRLLQFLKVDKWSFSVDVQLRFAALGHHPKPQHHWAGTVPMTKFGISEKLCGLLDSRDSYPVIPLVTQILGHHDVMMWFIWQVLWPATKEDIEILSQWQAWQAETYLVVLGHHNWAVISGPWVSFYNVLSRKLHWSHFSCCLSAMNSGFHINDSRCILKLMSVGLTNCIHDLSKLKVLWSSGRGGISRNAGKKPKTFFVVSTCFSKTSSFDDIWLEVHLGNHVK